MNTVQMPVPEINFLIHFVDKDTDIPVIQHAFSTIRAAGDGGSLNLHDIIQLGNVLFLSIRSGEGHNWVCNYQWEGTVWSHTVTYCQTCNFMPVDEVKRLTDTPTNPYDEV